MDFPQCNTLSSKTLNRFACPKDISFWFNISVVVVLSLSCITIQGLGQITYNSSPLRKVYRAVAGFGQIWTLITTQFSFSDHDLISKDQSLMDRQPGPSCMAFPWSRIFLMGRQRVRNASRSQLKYLVQLQGHQPMSFLEGFRENCRHLRVDF